MPQFEFYLSNRSHPVSKSSGVWSSPIPLHRSPEKDILSPDDGNCINYEDYFTAVRIFLEQDKLDVITRAISQNTGWNVKPSAIKEIQIFLEKHGAFYHPARIEANLAERTVKFVLNLAISDTGRRFIRKEYRILKQLNDKFPFSFLPKVYGQGSVFIKSKKSETEMFLGEWFDEFNEFHISIDPADGRYKIKVWDYQHDPTYLTMDQTQKLYFNVAKILTCYYNLSTFEHINSWHHGAGDFILKHKNNVIDLKLITARDYRPLLKSESGTDKQDDVGLIFEVLLIFLLKLLIRIRLDRIDGVGDVVWADTIAVQSSIKGFFDGLTLQAQYGLAMDGIDNYFLQHITAYSHNDLIDLNRSIVRTCYLKTPDSFVVQHNLEQHVQDVYTAIQNI